jgi:hypothetical protein
MAQERPTKKRGGITGRAYVVMGGKVALGTYNENGHFGGIAMAELKNEGAIGRDVTDEKSFPCQVYIEIDSLDSLNALRDVIDMAETELKDEIAKQENK